MIHVSIMRAARISYMLCIVWHCIRYTDTPSYSLRFSLSLKLALHIRIYQPSASRSTSTIFCSIIDYIVIVLVVKVHNKIAHQVQVYLQFSISILSTAIGYSDENIVANYWRRSI